jgi:hypothetical protein
MNSVPSEVFGENFFAPNATAKWPMNISDMSFWEMLFHTVPKVDGKVNNQSDVDILPSAW